MLRNMLIELTDDELEIIKGWYHTAARESASGVDNPEERAETVALLERLHFELDDLDQYILDHPGRARKRA